MGRPGTLRPGQATILERFASAGAWLVPGAGLTAFFRPGQPLADGDGVAGGNRCSANTEPVVAVCSPTPGTRGGLPAPKAGPKVGPPFATSLLAISCDTKAAFPRERPWGLGYGCPQAAMGASPQAATRAQPRHSRRNPFQGIGRFVLMDKMLGRRAVPRQSGTTPSHPSVRHFAKMRCFAPVAYSPHNPQWWYCRASGENGEFSGLETSSGQNDQVAWAGAVSSWSKFPPHPPSQAGGQVLH